MFDLRKMLAQEYTSTGIFYKWNKARPEVELHLLFYP